MNPAKSGYRFSLYVNQHMAMELGIENVNQAIIFDLLANASSWASPVIIDGEVYYWVARQMVCNQLPFLKLKPDTAYRHFRKLDSLGLVEHVKDGKRDCVRITEKGKTYLEMNPNNYVSKDDASTMSEINPNPYVGNKSDYESEINPTYKTNNTNNKTFSTKQDCKPTKDSSGTAKAGAKDVARLFEAKWVNHQKFDSEFDRIFKEAEVKPTEKLLKASKDEFCDYWLSGNTSKFKKTNWLATWRNWLRNDLKRNGWRYQLEQGASGTPLSEEGLSVLPTDDRKLERWAKQNGAPRPATGESYADYRQTLENFSRRQGLSKAK